MLESEREKQFNDFIDKDTILSGIVKRLEFGNIIVDLEELRQLFKKWTCYKENIKQGIGKSLL